MNFKIASIAQHSKALRLAAVSAQLAASLAEEAAQRNHSHLRYHEALIQAKVEDRERRLSNYACTKRTCRELKL